ncbi:uncharacterized protein LOC117294486 isoform X2 [Asterias rubens]|uniref:uncharacterized protein LOC117294486 isoform X2 n=1 Tax=Asterias rubens TaxID=7604 RepID=UPI0014550948|nr:uncharacterized protein LOC117294486 isoform X2 [Asterias rubens]
MASNKSALGLKPKWPGKEAHLSDGTGSESEVRFSVHSTASKGQVAQMEPSRVQGLTKSVASPGRGAMKEAKLDGWDPMEDDYNDSSFNSYNRGPGNGLLGNNQHQGDNRDTKYKLFVGNIPAEMTEDGLFNLFSPICDIKFTKVIPRKDQTGYGFVEVPSVKDGEEAIRRLDGHKIRGYGLRISFAREKSRSDSQGLRQFNPPSQSNVAQPSSKAKPTNGTVSSSADADGYASSDSSGKRKTPELRKVENRYGNVTKVVSPKAEPTIKPPTSSAPVSKVPSSSNPASKAPSSSNPLIKSPLQSLLQKMKYPVKDGPSSPKEKYQNDSTPKTSLPEGEKVTRSEVRGTGEVKLVGAASRQIQFGGSSSERKSDSVELIAKLKAGGVHLREKVPEEREASPASSMVKTEAVKAASPQPLLALPVKGNILSSKPSDGHQSQVSSIHHSTPHQEPLLPLPYANQSEAASINHSKHQEAGPSNRGILGPAPRDASLHHQGQMSQPPHGPSGQGYHSTCANCSQCDTEGHEPPPHYHQPQHPWNGPYRYSSPHAQYAQPPEGYPMYPPYQHSMPLRYPQYGPDPYGYNPPQYSSVPPSGHAHSYGQHFRYGTPRRGMNRGNFHRGEPRFPRDYYSSGYKVIPPKPRPDMPHSHPTRPYTKWEEHYSRGVEADTGNGSTQEAALNPTMKSRRTPVADPSPAGRPSENDTGKATAGGNGKYRRSSQRGTGSDSDSSSPKLCMNCKIKPGDHCCSRCKGLYCSRECQREHWPTHKNSCRQASTPDRSPKAQLPDKPKTMSPPKKTTTTTLLHGGAEGQFMAQNLPFETPDESRMEVFVTKVDSPGSVWVQIYKEQTVERFGKLSQALSDTYLGTSNSGEFSCTPKVGAVCAIQYSQDTFYRAEILSVEDDNSYSVLLIDFGITDTIMKQDVRKLKDKLLRLPKQALKCFLSGIQSPQGTWSKEATEKLQSLVKCHKCTVEFKGQGVEGREIELYDPSDNSLPVSTILVYAGLARSTKISAPSQTSAKPPSATTGSQPSLGSIGEDLTIGELIEVCVSHVESPGCFYANVVDLGSDLVELGQNINDFYSETTAQAGFSPKQGELCAARFSHDNCWYRAVVQKVPRSGEKNLYVDFIDYGNSDSVSLDECRPLEERFTSLPNQAIQCKLSGVKPTGGTDWQDDMTGAFKEWLATAPTVNINIQDKQDKYLVVEVFSPGAKEPECSFNQMLQTIGFAADDNDDKKESVTNQAAAGASGDSASANQTAMMDQPSASAATKQLSVAAIPDIKFDGFVTSVSSPLDFYLQVFSRENMVAFEALTNLLNTRYSLQDPVPFNPRVGDYCAVKSTDDAWYRARILEKVAPEPAFKVLFVDYGVEEVTQLDRITLLEDRFYDTPMFAVHCGLACVRKNSTINQNERAIAFFTEKVKEKQLEVEVVRKEENKCLVELLYPNDKEQTTIQKDLIKNGFASLLDVSPSNQVKPRTTPPNPEVASVPTVQPPKNFPGYVSAVGDRGDLYIQVVSQKNLDAVNELTEKLNAHYEKMQQRPHKPSIGEACVAKYSVDNSWYRVRVDELRATQARVLFVDYGNTETVSLDGIKKLDGDFFAVPQCCHHCYLSGVRAPSRGREWDSAATDILRKMVTPEGDSVKGFQVTVTKRDGEGCEVVIRYSNDGGDTWSLVNDDLIAHFNSPGPSGDHQPANGEPPQPASPANEAIGQGLGKSAEFETLPAGIPLTDNCICLVTVVNSPSDFFIQIPSEENIELDERLGNELRTKYDDGSMNPHEPKIGQLCAARFSADNAWYRARAVEKVAPESAVKVMFVDYGNVEVVALNEIRKLEGWLTEVPEFSHRCGIHGMIAPSGGKQLLWSEETIKHVKSKLENAMCTVDIVKNDGKVCEVEILYSSQEDQWINIKEELRELGLAEPIRAQPITSPEPVAPPITSPVPVRASPFTSPMPVGARPIASTVSSPTSPRDGVILCSSLKKMVLPSSAVNVIVNEIVSPLEFYCQMCIQEENEKLLTLMNDIQDYATKLPSDIPPYQPAIGDLCLAKFTDNYWYRGDIIKIKMSSQKALVKYIDFGNVEPLPWSQMHAAPQVFAELPIHAIKCGLSGVPLGASSSDENTKKFLQEQLSDESSPLLRATLQELTADGTSLVQLVEPESDKNINQIVAAYLKDAKPASSPDQLGARSRTPNGPSKVMTPGASPKVTTPGASPKVMTPGASPKVALPKASPQFITPKVVTPGASPKFLSSGASPKVTTPDPLAEAKRRETERKKKELEAKIEAQRRQLAEMEMEIANLGD